MERITEFAIGRKWVGGRHPCFVVAEISGNHRQSYEEAVRLIEAAAAAGADAVKLQTYTPDTMTINCRKEWFVIGGEDTPEVWRGHTLYELYQGIYTPWEWQPRLKAVADGLGLLLFSTPFDETAVDFLEEMGVPCYKVASYEATDIPLLCKVAAAGKPVILSIGFASLGDVELAVATLRECGVREIAVLHCVTGYAAEPNLDAMNLRTISDIRERFGLVAGFSDNHAGIEVAVLAAAAGAAIIEKHLILDRASGGADASFSIEPAEFKAMVDAIRWNERIIGRVHYGPASAAEKYNRRFRRSLFAVQDIKAGERLTRVNVRVIRPEFGLAPRHLDAVLGKVAACDIEAGTPLSWDVVR